MLNPIPPWAQSADIDRLANLLFVHMRIPYLSLTPSVVLISYYHGCHTSIVLMLGSSDVWIIPVVKLKAVQSEQICLPYSKKTFQEWSDLNCRIVDYFEPSDYLTVEELVTALAKLGDTISQRLSTKLILSGVLSKFFKDHLINSILANKLNYSFEVMDSRFKDIEYDACLGGNLVVSLPGYRKFFIPNLNPTKLNCNDLNGTDVSVPRNGDYWIENCCEQCQQSFASFLNHEI